MSKILPLMDWVLEMDECLNKNDGVARAADAGSDAVVNSRVCLESARCTVADLPFFRAYLTALPVQKTAIG